MEELSGQRWPPVVIMRNACVYECEIGHCLNKKYTEWRKFDKIITEGKIGHRPASTETQKEKKNLLNILRIIARIHGWMLKSEWMSLP